MEAVIQSYFPGRTVSPVGVDPRDDYVFIPAPAVAQSKIWWYWSWTKIQQTVVPNIENLYACEVVPQMQGDDVMVSAVLYRQTGTPEIYRLVSHSTPHKINMDSETQAVVFLTKNSYLSLLKDSTSLRGKENQVLRKCQSWIVTPGKKKQIVTTLQKVPVGVPGLVVAGPLSYPAGLEQNNICAVLVDAALKRMRIVVCGNKVAKASTKNHLTVKYIFEPNANQAAYRVANLIKKKWTLIKFSPTIYSTLRCCKTTPDGNDDEILTQFLDTANQLTKTLSHACHGIKRPGKRKNGLGPLVALAPYLGPSCERLMKAVIEEEYAYGNRDSKGQKKYPVDGYYEIMRQNKNNDVDFLSLL